MPKRCGDPLCECLVNERKPHVRIGDKVFCDDPCAQAWLLQNQVFEVAADPFREPIHKPPRRMNGG